MGSTADKITGHAKETVGDLTGDKDLENEGKAQRIGGVVKEKVADAVDAVTDKVRDTLHRD